MSELRYDAVFPATPLLDFTQYLRQYKPLSENCCNWTLKRFKFSESLISFIFQKVIIPESPV